MTDSVAIFSGGLDSTTLVYDMLSKGYRPHLISFNYGQRHVKELAYAAMTAKTLDLPHNVVDLTGLTHLISNSALTSNRGDRAVNEIEVPDGHYAEETMKATVVPNRNMIMLSIAAGIAANDKARTIGIGVHAGDHVIYPDCRPIFVESCARTIFHANDGFSSFEEYRNPTSDGYGPLHIPFINATKADIAYRALELNVPLHLTWSCYKGGINHCGRCGTCVERLEAIDEAIRRTIAENSDHWSEDMTEYDDTEFWKIATKKEK